MTEPISGQRAWARVTRGLVVLGAGVLAVFAVAAVSAGAAQGQFRLELNHGELRLGSHAFNRSMLAIFDGDIDPATGELTQFEGVELPVIPIGPNGRIVPRLQGPVTVTSEGDSDLELNMLVDLYIGTPTYGCQFEDFEWSFSTSNSFGPLQGHPFWDGLHWPGGAIVASWEDLPASPATQVCNELRVVFGGPGGFLLERVPGELDLSLRPTSKQVERGEGTTFTATVMNTSNIALTGVEVCVRAPESAIRVIECSAPGSLDPGEIARRRFSAKATGNAKPRPYRLRFRATGFPAEPASANATLRVRTR
jgi:hypothetical protein